MLAIGLYYKSRAASSFEEYFLSGRNVPWWLAGTSMVDILSLIVGVSELTALFIVIGMIAVTSFISTLSGLWGVLVTDLVQFVLKMGMVIVLAVYAVQAVGGIEAMKTQLAAIDVKRG